MKTKVKLVAIVCGIFVALVCTTQTSDAISTRTVAKPSTDLKFKQLSTARLDTLGKCEGNNGICFVRGGVIYIGEWLEFGQ